MTGDDTPSVVSPEAEKVSVLQTVINPTRTTFYNKKQNKEQAIVQTVPGVTFINQNQQGDNQATPSKDIKADKNRDIANKEIRPDVYKTVWKMVDPTPERRRVNPPKVRTWDDGPKKPDEDDDTFLKKQISAWHM